MKTKKLLAIILSLALLIGLVPAAGLLTTAAAAEEATDTDPTVYEIVFTAGEKFDVGYYDCGYSKIEADPNETYTFTFTFEYYLDCDMADPFTFGWTGENASAVTGSTVLQKGRHTASFGATVTSKAISPRFTAKAGVSGTLYAWNLRVTANGKPISIYRHDPWDCTWKNHSQEKLTEDCKRTTADVSSEHNLSYYDFGPDENGNVKVKTVYVDQNGGTGSDDDTTNDGSEGAPYASLYKAMQVIESSLYLEGEIIIVGNYTNKDAFEMIGGTTYIPPTDSVEESPANYTTPVTIRGEDGKSASTLYTGADMWLFGPTTFDDITLQKDASGSGDFYIHARHNAVHFGSNAARKGTPHLYGGVKDLQYDKGATKAHELTVNFYMGNVFLGNMYSYTDTTDEARTVPGVNYVQNIFNDGTARVRTIYIGTQGSNTDSKSAGTIFTDDVNITVNGGSVGHTSSGNYGIYISRQPISDAAPNDFGGNAVQILFNNGTGMVKDDDAFPTADAVKKCHGSLYVLHCAAGGSQLAVTEDAGVYTVADPNWVAIATGTDAEGNAVEKRSVDGVLTVPAGEYNVTWEVPPTVYETAFTEGEKIGLGHYTCTGANKTTSDAQGYACWNVSFEYFLNASAEEAFTFSWGNIDIKNASGSFALERGWHTATLGIDVTSSDGNYAISPVFTAKAGVSGTLYAWNLKVTVNGNVREYYAHKPWVCDCDDERDFHSTASITSEKTLDQYNFDEMDDGSVAPSPATTHAVQIRAEGALRFISTVKGIGAERNDDGTANYENAYITVDGTKYKVTTAGTLFAREKKLGDAELVYGAKDVYDIPAGKLQEAKHAKPSYGFDENNGDILFTGVITNIPEANRDETLVARAYVAYTKDNKTVYEYGDVLKRAYNEVLSMLEAPAVDGTLKVLAIGNSFSQDAMQHLWEMCHDSGLDTVVLANLYIGGSTLNDHWSNIQKQDDADEAVRAEAAAYTYDKNSEGIWTRTPNYTIADALAAENWDVITIQQGSAYSGSSASYSNLDNILTYLEDNKPEDARIMWHMTWAYQSNFDDLNPDSTSFDKYDNDQTTMYNGILDAVNKKVLTDERISAVIPSGTAIQNLRTSYIGDTVTRDGFHLSYDRGRYTAALTWYCKLTGRNASSVTTIPSGYLDVLREDLTVMQEAVDNALVEPYQVTESTYNTAP